MPPTCDSSTLALLLAVLVTSGTTSALDREAIRSELNARALRIMSVVEEIRGLEFKADVPIEPMSRVELRQFLEASIAEELPAGYIETYQKAYRALGMIPGDYDVLEGFMGLIEVGVLGLYDQKTKRLYVLEDAPLDGNTEIILAHELLHALEDQHFDLEALIGDLADLENEDREFAIKGLVEGSATHIMDAYMAKVSMSISELLGGQMKMMRQIEGMPETPMVLLRDLSMPYTRGKPFIDSISRRGDGWRAVDAAFRDPPVSSEQVLHPDRYGRDFPREIEMPDLTPVLGPGWAPIWENTLGEMRVAALLETLAGGTETYLSAQTTRGTSKASTGWDGDRYVVCENPESGAIAVAVVSEWDTVLDAREFATEFAEHALAALAPTARRLSDGGGVVLRARDGRRVYLVEISGARVVIAWGFRDVAATDVVTALFQAPATVDPRERAPEGSQSQANAPDLSFVDEDAGYGLQLPEQGWRDERREAPMGLGSMHAFIRDEGAAELQVLVLPSGAAVPLDMLMDLLTQQARAGVEGARVGRVREREFAGASAREVRITGPEISVRVIAISHAGDLVVLTLRLPEIAGESARHECEKILDSFVLLGD